MKKLFPILTVAGLLLGLSSEASASERTDVYQVLFGKAALGKSSAVAEMLKSPPPSMNMNERIVILRHQSGDSWDYVVIQHLGAKATVEAKRAPAPTTFADLVEWHNDSLLAGPSWEEFSKAMGADAKAKPVYIVSNYRPAPGHREQLEKLLGQIPNSEKATGNVILQHLEGSAWTYLEVSRYDSYADIGKSLGADDKAWHGLRDHASYHTDTICDRLK